MPTIRSIPACAGEPRPSPPLTDRRRVYPRVCGGTPNWDLEPCHRHGLSPRVRGNLDDDPSRSYWMRSIPACAGEPGRVSRSHVGRTVYPRVCGGTVLSTDLETPEFGLSPRVRGNPAYASRHTSINRSIPACAGEPPAHALPENHSTVYPRVCGGTSDTSSFEGICGGLSPRVRGNHLFYMGNGNNVRSIPACAGEPAGKTSQSITYSVYPRVCGGTRWSSSTGALTDGLSPRVRGNREVPQACIDVRRSIPACAGEPRSVLGGCVGHAVYPRVCGGTYPERATPHRTRGLSPRVRGNPGSVDAEGARLRSIPACAGEPVHPRKPRLQWEVYPRVCGGTGVQFDDDTWERGLSPRVRGNRRLRIGRFRGRGSIPACAGEPPNRSPIWEVLGVYPRVCGGTVIASSPFPDDEGLSPRVRGNPKIG